jgi:thiol-disulfide isomerase/thioredoxin
MKSLLLLLLVPFLMTQSATVEVLKWPALQDQLSNKSGKIKVFTFWSAGCKTCVEELPHFEQLHRSFGNQLEVVLVSVDQPSVLESKINPIIDKNRITAKVLILDEVDSNAWIDKVDPAWTGAIPATVIIDADNKRHLYEKALSYQELVKIVNSFHKPQ